MKCLVTRASLMTRFIQKIITSTSNRPLALKKRLGRDFHALNGRRNWNGFTQTLTRRTIGIYGLRNWAAAWKIDNRQNLRPAVSRERIFAEPSIERQSDKLYSATESNGVEISAVFYSQQQSFSLGLLRRTAVQQFQALHSVEFFNVSMKSLLM